MTHEHRRVLRPSAGPRRLRIVRRPQVRGVCALSAQKVPTIRKQAVSPARLGARASHSGARQSRADRDRSRSATVRYRAKLQARGSCACGVDVRTEFAGDITQKSPAIELAVAVGLEDYD